MNRWEEKFNEHEVHKTIALLSEAVSKEFSDLDEGEVSEKRRFFKLISAIDSSLKALDSELISFDKIDALNDALEHSTIQDSVKTYTENGDVESLVTANDSVEDAIEFIPLASINVASARDESLNSLEKLIDASSSTLIAKKDKLVEELSALEKLTKDTKLEFEKTVVEKEKKIEELVALVEKNKAEVNSQISDWQNQFSTAQDKRSADYSQWRDSFSSDNASKIESIISAFKEKLTLNAKSFQDETNSILEDGNEKHQSILALYELTAGDSVGAGYVQNADAEKTQADSWRWLSVGFIIITVFWLFYSYHSTTKQANYDAQPIQVAIQSLAEVAEVAEVADNPVYNVKLSNENTSFPWVKIFLSFSISGVLLWGSAYCAQQSTIHRNNEKRTRRFALEVKAFDPFISSLDSTQKNELKKEFSKKIFGQEALETKDNPKILDEHASKGVLDIIDKLVSKIPKSP